MTTGFTSKNVLLNNASQAVAINQTDQVVSTVWRNQAQDSLYSRVDITTSAGAATCTAKLQDSWDGLTWFDKKTVAITTAATVSITLMPEVAGDQTYLPLRPLSRVVVTTDGTGSATITAITRSYYA